VKRSPSDFCAACSMIVEINMSVSVTRQYEREVRRLSLASGSSSFTSEHDEERAAVPGCRRTLLFGIRSAGGFQSGK